MVPFIGSEALAAGVVNRYQLANRYDAVFRNVYVPKGHALGPVDKAIAAWLWSDRRTTVAGLSAAALYGSLWIDAALPAELNQPSRAGQPLPRQRPTTANNISNGLRPQRTQIEVFDKYAYFVGRIDMGWEDRLVGVEYDGVQHWTDSKQRTKDIDRHAEFEALFWRIVRVSAEMLRYRPGTIVARTRAALLAGSSSRRN